VRVRAVLTDLDGTLLEPDGTLATEAVAALAALAGAGVPVCPITSKTAAELAPIMARLGLTTPAGFENGAGIRRADGLTELLPAAVPLETLLAVFAALRHKSGAPARSMLELGDDELGALTGLAGVALAGARTRLASLPLVVETRWDDALRAALPDSPRLCLVRGNRFLHLQGNHGKGDAAARVLQLAGRSDGAVVACGDAPNDAELLAAADIAVIVPSRGGPNSGLVGLRADARVAPRPHGRGWAAAMMALLDEAEPPSPPSARSARGSR
jgi:mannosyl-3-phosphoglycerate phosphatase